MKMALTCPTLAPTSTSDIARTVEWIAPAAALPDDDILVLIALDDQEVWPAVRDYGRWIYVSGAEVRQRVTHWMHLPPAPGARA